MMPFRTQLSRPLALLPPYPLLTGQGQAGGSRLKRVVDALHTVLRALRGKSFDILDYGNEFDFRLLWSVLRDSSSFGLEPDPIIVWASTAPDPLVSPVSTAPHVSPVDWAACYASRRPGAHVTLLDLDPPSHASVPSVRLFRRFDRRALPWLRVLDGTDTARLLLPLLQDGCGDSHPDVVTPDEFLSLSTVSLTNRADSWHSIANLVGPLLLSGADFKAPSPHQEALLELLSCSGMAVSASHAGVPATVRPREGDVLRILLLDDQWKHGWAAWISSVLGLSENPGSRAPAEAVSGASLFARSGGIELWVSGDPEWLAHDITRTLEEPGEDLRFRLDLLPKPAVNERRETVDVLLLDLRLFSGLPDKEKSFLHTVANLCRRLHERPGLLRAWDRGFSEWEVEGALRWAGGGPPPEDAFRLSLFPRLLSQLDPSLPIVIFSSTAQRKVLEALKPYSNIITAFEKPRPAAGQPIDVERVTETFRNVLAEAVHIAEGRASLRRISMAASSHPRPEPGLAAEGSWTHAALYLDESGGDQELGSGKGVLTLGGLLGLFATEQDEQTFDVSLKNEGIHWGPRDGLPKWASPAMEERVLGVVRGASLPGHPVALVGIAVSARTNIHLNTPMGPNESFSRNWLDQLHRTLLRLVCEIALFRLAVGPDRRSAAILADMRCRPRPDDDTAAVLLQFGHRTEPLSLDERLVAAAHLLSSKARGSFFDEDRAWLDGFLARLLAGADPSAIARGMKMPYLSAGDLHPLVTSLFEARAANPVTQNLRIVEAQACPLPEGRASALHWPNRSLHFLADWFVRSVHRAQTLADSSGQGDVAASPGGCWEPLAREGLVGVFAQPLLGLLEVANDMDEGRLRTGVTRLASGGHWLLSGPPGRVQTDCLRSIARGLSATSGPDLISALRAAAREEEAVVLRLDPNPNKLVVRSALFGDAIRLSLSRAEAAARPGRGTIVRMVREARAAAGAGPGGVVAQLRPSSRPG